MAEFLLDMSFSEESDVDENFMSDFLDERTTSEVLVSCNKLSEPGFTADHNKFLCKISMVISRDISNFQGSTTDIPNLLHILDQDLFNSLPEGPEFQELIDLDKAKAKVTQAAGGTNFLKIGSSPRKECETLPDASDCANTVEAAEILEGDFSTSVQDDLSKDICQAEHPGLQSTDSSVLDKELQEKVDPEIEESETADTSPTNQVWRALYQMKGNIRSYYCEKCGFTRTTKGAVEGHINQEHYLQKSFQCTDCNFETFNPQCFSQHTKRCNQRIKCDFCSYSTTKVSDMKRHCARKHKET